MWLTSIVRASGGAVDLGTPRPTAQAAPSPEPQVAPAAPDPHADLAT